MRVVVLTAFLFSFFSSPAAASPVTPDEGLNKVGSVVESVVESPGGSTSPVPKPPVVTPQVPKVGSVEPEITREPAPAPVPRAPSSVEPSGGADPVSSVPGSGSLRGTRGADTAAGAGAAAGAGTGAHAKVTAAPDPAQTGARPGHRARAGSGDGSSDSAPGSVRAAMPAPLEEWLARLWPAVALGPIGSALTAQLAELAPSLLPPSLSPFTQPSLSPTSAPTGGGPTATPTAQAAAPDSHPFFSPHGGGMSFLVTLITVLATLVGLVALARLAYGEDFFTLRWLH